MTAARVAARVAPAGARAGWWFVAPALALLDAQVNRILEKRRWILARNAHAQHDSAAAVKIR